MTASVIRLGEVSATQLADRLDTEGVVRIRDAFSEEWLGALRLSVTDHVAGYGDGDFLIAQPGLDVGSPAHQLVSDPTLQQLFGETARLRWPTADTAQPIKSGIPVRAGTGRSVSPNQFHYDATVLTMLVPVFIPQTAVGSGGELVAVANKRPFRRSVGAHLADLLLTYNSAYRHVVAKRACESPDDYVVDLEPGDAYVFWGYRTYHGNLHCAPGQLRATLVLQYADVHADTPTLRALWRFGRSRRALRDFQYRPGGDSARGAADVTHV